VGTELRFMAQLEKSRSFEESEKLTRRAVFIALTFMPDQCPIVDYIVNAYLKNYTGE